MIQSFMLAIALMSAVKLWIFNETTKSICQRSANIPKLAAGCQEVLTTDADDQARYSLEYGWLIAVGGVAGLILSYLCINLISRRAWNQALKIVEGLTEHEADSHPIM